MNMKIKKVGEKMEKKTEGHESLVKKVEQLKTFVFIIGLACAMLMGGLGMLVMGELKIKERYEAEKKGYELEIERINKEKQLILDTAFYVRDRYDYYIKDSEKFEKFMLDGTRIILEEVDKYKVLEKGRMSKEEMRSFLEKTYVGCNLVGIDPYVSLFQTVRESQGFDKNVKGSLDERGVEQIRPLTAKLIANSISPWKELQTSFYSETLLFDPVESKKISIRYMKYLLEEFDGRIEWALVAYNAGAVRAKEYWKDGEAIFQEDVPEKYRKYADFILSQYVRVSGAE